MASVCSIHYRDHVNQTLVSLSNIKRKVWVLFATDDEDNKQNSAWYRGEIQKVRMQLDENDGSVGIEHYIQFDDGETYWFSLDEQEDMKHLCWEDPANDTVVPVTQEVDSQDDEDDDDEEEEEEEDSWSTASTISQLPVVSTAHSEETQQQQRPTNEDSDVVSGKEHVEKTGREHARTRKKRTHCGTDRVLIDRGGQDHIKDDVSSLVASKSHAHEQSRKDDTNNANKKPKVNQDAEEDSDTVDKERATQFHTLKGSMKKWVQDLGLADAYGTKCSGLDTIKDNENIYVMPDSFEHLFRLADFLFPGKTYHKTLFENQATTPGQPIHDLLRDLKMENPSNPLVSWHKEGDEWNPPTALVCHGMITLIMDMLERVGVVNDALG